MKTSVAICTYNGEKFLEIQLDSVLNQTQQVDEIVVCDDGSNDRTIQILENYILRYPSIIKVFKNKTQLGSIKNFEKAISLCTNDIIFLSDQDDIWIDEKVKDFVDFFTDNPSINVIASNGFCIDENGTVEDKYAIWDVPQFLKDSGKNFKYFDLIVNVANIATGASMAFRKSFIKKTVPFPITKEMQHDEWIALISSKEESFAFLDKKYFYYRIHDSQQLGGVFYDKKPEVKKYLTRFFDLYQDEKTFQFHKKRLKKLCKSYEKNKHLIFIESEHSNFFYAILQEIENDIELCKNSSKLKYPTKTLLLSLADKITNKRQFNKVEPKK